MTGTSENRPDDRKTTLNRRQMLGLLGTAGVAAAGWGCGVGGNAGSGTASGAGTAAETTAASASVVPSCVLMPEVTQGPYYLEGDKVRRDITEDRRGVPLRLKVTVVDAKECMPLEAAAVDIWHCDAGGAYSGFVEASEQANSGGMGGGIPGGEPGGEPPEPPGDGEMPEGGPPEGGAGGGMQAERTDDFTFLRGVQLTDADGLADFETIYPGWYTGRALHIHLKVMLGGTVEGKTYEGGHTAHTGQLFFPEEVTEEVEQVKPYSIVETERMKNDEDGIFEQAGEGSVVKIEGSVEDGYTAEIVVGVDPEAEQQSG